MASRTVAIALLLAGSVSASGAQSRSMAQDATANNLRHAPGTTTTAPPSLGHITKSGAGPRKVLLLPGLGFADDVWAEFMERHKADATMVAVTFPGFGGTSPMPMPPDGTPYASLTWTQAIVRGLEALLVSEGFTRVTIVAHWALASQVAMQLSLDHPDRVDAVILIGGPLKVYYEGAKNMLEWTAAQRAQFVEGMASGWFKTVTRRTWDDNNFMSYDYAVNPRRGLFLWREAQEPSLPVWIRYLLEFYSIDLSVRLKDLARPMLVVRPGFDDAQFYVEPDRNYMRNLCLDSWRGAEAVNERIEFVTVPQSRLFVMFDQPEVLDRIVGDFLARRAPLPGTPAAAR
ncbi:MAG: alpha/beta hydrolase [Vicinamibacterales bacterium]